MLATRFAAFFAAALSVTAAAAQPPPAPPANPPTADDCIRSSGMARFNGSGFTHRVHITNVCAAAASCLVSTDVTPEPTKVVAPPLSDIDVTTFLDSPASAFTGQVVCTMPASQ